MFCQATGFGGTVQQGNTVEAKLKAREAARNEALEAAAATREVTVSFNANVADGLPWRFSPTQRAVTIHPGQSTLAFYTAHNLGDRDITGRPGDLASCHATEHDFLAKSLARSKTGYSAFALTCLYNGIHM